MKIIILISLLNIITFGCKSKSGGLDALNTATNSSSSGSSGSGESSGSNGSNNSNTPVLGDLEYVLNEPYDGNLRYIKIAKDDGTSCGLLNNGAIRCWGDFQSIEENYSSHYDAKEIVPPNTAVDVGIADDNFCYISNAGALMCFGDAQYLAMGSKEATFHYDNNSCKNGCYNKYYYNAPQTMKGLVNGVLSPITGAYRVAGADDNTCALLSGGKVRCFGPEELTGDGQVPEFVGGVYKSADNGATFIRKSALEGLDLARVTAIAVDGNYVYVADENYGLLISSDGGSTYPNKYKIANIHDLYVNAGKIYVASDTGLYISNDHGATFINKTSADGLVNDSILAVAANGPTIITGHYNALSVSTDGGASFTVHTDNNFLYVGQIYINGAKVYIADYYGFAHSTDSGATFQHYYDTGYTTSVAVATDGTIYLSGDGLYVSTDDGTSFTKKTITGSAGPLTVDSSGKLYLIMVNNYRRNNSILTVSSDKGDSFTELKNVSDAYSAQMSAVYHDGTNLFFGMSRSEFIYRDTYQANPVKKWDGTELSDAVQLTIGDDAACTLLKSTEVMCWGQNSDGNLGSDADSRSEAEYLVATLDQCGPEPKDVLDPQFIDNLNNYNICKNNQRSIDRSRKAQYVFTDSSQTTHLNNVIKIAQGDSHVCAIVVESGILGDKNYVKCWGANGDGQIGNKSSDNYFRYPQYVLDKNGDKIEAVDISAIEYATCAITPESKIMCWGTGNSGVLGNRTVYEDPQQNPDANDKARFAITVEASPGVDFTGAEKLFTGGEDRSVCVQKGQDMYCWGDNDDGQSGVGYGSYVLTPKKVIPAGSGLIGISGSMATPITNGSFLSRGDNSYGQLADGTTNYRNNYVVPLINSNSPLSNIVKVARYNYMTLALDNNGVLYGSGVLDQLGSIHDGVNDGDVTLYAVDLFSAILGNTIVDFAYSDQTRSSCYIIKNGIAPSEIKCVNGYADELALLLDNNPYVDTLDNSVKTAVGTNLLNAEKIIATYYSFCSLQQNNEVYCWGRNNYYELGTGTTDPSLVAVKVMDGGSPLLATKIFTDEAMRTCAIEKTSGAIKCWGHSENTDLFATDTITLTTLPGASGATNAKIATSVGCYYAAGTKKVYCWGRGKLGDNDLTPQPAYGPVEVLTLALDEEPANNDSALYVNNDFSCLFLQDQSAYCWGSGGQVPTYRTNTIYYPAKVVKPEE